ncbi:MAG: divergent polysaccharide deacetylase family protein [Candidatus Goldiibacteriota bacterium]
MKKAWAVFFAAAGLILVYYLNVYVPEQKKKLDAAAAAERPEAVNYILREILLSGRLITNVKGSEYTVKLPLRYSPGDIKPLMKKHTASRGGVDAKVRVFGGREKEGAEVLFFIEEKEFLKVIFERSLKPKIAVILDDYGYNTRNLHYLKKIKYPFTAAVLPNQPYSRAAAAAAHKNGKEVIMHLPMEPKGNIPLEPKTVKNNMTAKEITDVFSKSLETVPYAAGVNNHQGSLATENVRLMSAVLEQIRKNNFYFIDSRTSVDTKGLATAGKMGVPSNWRNIFIDNEKDIDYNRVQLEQAESTALKKGYAVAIGHDSKTTYEALMKFMPESEERGYEFVFASELVF